MAADPRRFEHGRAEGVAVVLRQEAANAGDFARGQRGERPAIERYRAGRRRTQAGPGVQERGVAGAVAAEDRPALSWRDREIQLSADADCGDGYRQNFYRGGGALPR